MDVIAIYKYAKYTANFTPQKFYSYYTIQSFYNYVSKLHPEVYYQYNGTILSDIIGGYDATIHGTESTDYNISTSLSGDTLDSSIIPLTTNFYITQTNLPTYSLNNVSLQILVKSNSTTANGLLASLTTDPTSSTTFTSTYNVYVGTDYFVRLSYVSSTGTNINLVSTTSINDGNLHLLHLVVKDGITTLYIDGRSSITNSDYSVTNASFNLVLGYSANLASTNYTNGAAVPYNGYIGDVVWFNKPLSQYEIDDLNNIINPNYTGTIVTYASDDYIDNVVLHASFDGTPNSLDISTNTGLTFENNTGFLPSNNLINSTKLSNLRSKFGNTSLYFNGTSNSQITFSDERLAFGTADFTIEFWVYIESNTNAGHIFGLYNNYDGSTQYTTNGLLIYYGVNQDYLRVWNTNSQVDLIAASTATFTLNTWIHVALVRKGSYLYLYKDGILVGSASYTSSIDNYVCVLGGYSTNMLDGFISELRITKGICRYTTTFTPPTNPFTPESLVTVDVSDYDIYNGMVLSELIFDNYNNGAVNIIDNKNITWTSNTIDTYVSNTNGRYPNSSALVCDAVNATNGTSGLYNNTSDLIIGTNDFCIEMWIYVSLMPVSSGEVLLDQRASTSNGVYPYLLIEGSSTQLVLGWYINGGYQLISTPFQLKKWTHIAISRKNNITSFYINGYSTSSYNDTNDYLCSITRLGYGITANSGFNGLINYFRMTVGNSRYYTNFTPPNNTNLNNVFAYPNTVSLLTGNGHNLSTNVYDTIVGNEWTLTAGANLSTNYSDDGSTSIYFNGSTSGYAISQNTNYIANTSDFTIELMLLVPEESSTELDFLSIWDTYTSSTTASTIGFSIAGNSLYPRTYLNNYVQITSSIALVPNEWTHIALVNSNDVYTMYVNGHNVGTYSATLTHNEKTILLGANTQNGAICYIKNYRMIKGSGIYSGLVFTPPNHQFDILRDKYSNYVTSLLHFDGAASSTTIQDQVDNNIWTVNGTAYISQTQSAISGSSLFLDGSTGYLTSTASANYNLTTTNYWTIECYIWVNSFPSSDNMQIMCKDGVAGTSYPQYLIGIQNSNKELYIELGNGTGTNLGVQQFLSTNAFSTNTWYHIAVVRNGSTLTAYVNGEVWIPSTAITFTMVEGEKPLYIGYQNGQGSSTYFNGYIDEVRITKGIARYTESFSSPIYQYSINKEYYYATVTPTPTISITPTPSVTPTLTVTPTPSLTISPNQYAKDIINYMVSYYNMDYNLNDYYGRNNLSGTFTSFTSAGIEGSGAFENATNQNISGGVKGITWSATQPEVSIGSWIFVSSSFTAPSNDQDIMILSYNYNSTGNERLSLGIDTGGFLKGFIQDSSSSNVIAIVSSTTFTLGAWNHIGLVVDSSTLYMYLNSVLVASSPLASGFTVPTISNIALQAGTNFPNNSTLIPIDEMFISNKALTANHISYLYNSGSGKLLYQMYQDAGMPYAYTDRYASKVTSLMHFEGANNSTTITDETGLNIWSSTGNPVISTTEYRYGSSSIYFNGSSYITSPYNISTSILASNDYTVEMWVNPSAVPSGPCTIFSINYDTTSYAQLRLGTDSSNRWNMLINTTTANAWIDTSNYYGGSWTIGNWYHIAIVKSNLISSGTCNIILYVNGIATVTETSAPDVPYNNQTGIILGYQEAVDYFTGYIDDFRVTQGVARYTTNFTPPEHQLFYK